MSTPAPKPTLLLIHGSFHRPAHFTPLTTALHQLAYATIAVSLPSTSPPSKTSPPPTFASDIHEIRTAVLHALRTANVIAIAHSYGGAPANAALADLTTTPRREAGEITAVIGFAFIAALPLPPHTSLVSLMGERRSQNQNQNPIYDHRGSRTHVWIAEPPGAEWYFYHDIPAQEAKHWSSLLEPQAWAAYEGVTESAAYEDLGVQVGYLVCLGDRVLLVGAQRGVVDVMEGARGGAAGGAGARVGVVEVEGGHSPFLARVEETVRFVEGVVERAVEREGR